MNERVEAIEDDIDRIRARMEARMESLSGEMNPSNLLQGVLGSNGQSGDNLKALAAQAKANPLATGLIGAGIAAYFMVSERKPTTDHLRASNGAESADHAERIGERVSSLQDHAAELKRDASIKVSVATAQVKGKIHATKAALSEASGSISEAAERAASSLSSKTADIAETVEHSVRRAPVAAKARAEGAADWVKENPVPAGLMALAAGAALSSFFTARKTTSRLDASRQLHEEARENGVSDGVRGSERIEELSEAAQPATTKRKQSNAQKPSRKSKPAKVKPKPIPTRTAKARTLKGKPELPASAQGTLKSTGPTGRGQYG